MKYHFLYEVTNAEVIGKETHKLYTKLYGVITLCKSVSACS
jgi:hypothetical protein